MIQFAVMCAIALIGGCFLGGGMKRYGGRAYRLLVVSMLTVFACLASHFGYQVLMFGFIFAVPVNWYLLRPPVVVRTYFGSRSPRPAMEWMFGMDEIL